MMNIRINRAAIILLTSLILMTNSAHAAECSCKFKQEVPPITEFNKSDVVFMGEVTKNTDIETEDKRWMQEVTFSANKHYKGPIETTIIVYTPRDAGECGYSFEKGESYFVYAKYNKAILYTDICTRTRTLSEAKVHGDITSLEAMGFGKQNQNKEYQLLQNSWLKAAYYSDAVFSGKVIKIESSKEKKDLLNITLDDIHLYRGWLDGMIIVHTPKSGGYDFKIGERYIIFANYREGVLYVDRNSIVKNYEKACRDGDYQIIALLNGYQWFGAGLLENNPGGRKYAQEYLLRYGGTEAEYNKLDFTRLFKTFKDLVASYYPQAKITTSEDGFRFEHKTKFYMISAPSVPWMPAPSHPKVAVEVPREGGILGTVFVYHSTSSMPKDEWVYGGCGIDTCFAPEPTAFVAFGQDFQLKKFKNCYLHVRLVYPKKEYQARQFFESFVKIAKNFDSYVDGEPKTPQEIISERFQTSRQRSISVNPKNPP